MLREARIIIPLRDNEGQLVNVGRVGSRIKEMFGGYTMVAGIGVDANYPAEPIAIFDIAMEVSGESRERFIDLALWAGHLARQNVVYIRHASGEAQFVDIPKGKDHPGKLEDRALSNLDDVINKLERELAKELAPTI
jgi:hypothetical protein